MLQVCFGAGFSIKKQAVIFAMFARTVIFTTPIKTARIKLFRIVFFDRTAHLRHSFLLFSFFLSGMALLGFAQGTRCFFGGRVMVSFFMACKNWVRNTIHQDISHWRCGTAFLAIYQNGQDRIDFDVGLFEMIF